MNFTQILQKLKYSNRFNNSLLSKEIIVNIHHVNKTELLNILELLHDTVDMEYQVKLITILTAYLLFNNSCRDVIVKSTTLYETLRMILARGLPLKTATTLNFITTLLYAEGEGGSRSRTLTLHAQNLIRSSGCLTSITHLFMNYMLHTETWQALCRCLVEVCRGSEPNQNLCSHLVPLCVQRCLQGNLDVIPVLQSLLFNHKRNTKLFMETDGPSIFYRKDYLILEACLQLLNTVIQNAEVEAITTLSRKIHTNLQELLKMKNNNVVQWTTIVLYYLDSKLKGNDISNRSYKTVVTNANQNTLDVDSNVHDTQTLFQNIMTEILSYPSKTNSHIKLNNVSKMPDKWPNLKNKCVVEETIGKYECNHLEKELAPSSCNKLSQDKKLSFSFLMDESVMFDPSDHNKNNIFQKSTVDQPLLKNKMFNQSREVREYSKFRRDTLKANNSKCDMKDFKPTFVSTPKRSTKMNTITRNTSNKRYFIELNNKSRNMNRTSIKKVPKKRMISEQQNIKHRSMSSRIFDVINESCTTVIKSFKNVFAGNKSSNVPNATVNIKCGGNEDQKSFCSYSFTKYMHRREAGLMGSVTNKDFSSEMNTPSSLNVCNTCDDTIILQQKFASDEQLKSTVKKLKLGINLYGCDFKRISKNMWPRETYMTPNVLYNLYRKLLLK